VIFALAGRGSDAAPVDGNRELARSLDQWEDGPRDTVPNGARLATPATETIASLPESWAGAPNIRLRYSRSLALAPPLVDAVESSEPEQAAPVLQAHELTVRPGDSLYTLFKARGLAREDLAAIVAAGKPTAGLSRLRPGDRITVYTDMTNTVQGLTHARGKRERLNVARVDGKFRAGVAARPANAVTVSAAPVNSNDWIEWHKPTPSLKRRSIAVGNGDSLYAIFKRNGFPLGELDAIVKANDETRQLTRLVPGQRIEFHLTTESSTPVHCTSAAMASAMTAGSSRSLWTDTSRARPAPSTTRCSSPASGRGSRTRSSCSSWRFSDGTWISRSTFAKAIDSRWSTKSCTRKVRS
jgi:cell envelope opacity-associated protein A